ncbi:nicotinate-nucleotide--dimethylbenzimidazole phosphoribosyltransferase [Aquidulcibacter sp.]|jgi:nicotinate-nucleotide--dimethylbenzimidazole phosphoribosyltransferase|uniref:nicotinate-nucleotide--dimethylbenzimidazole phosphoribosyltransferase n=2 Tax=Aquidulcibacter sp. TaxID=2052990 RepID=UPI003BA480B3
MPHDASEPPKQPFDDIRALLQDLPSRDEEASARTAWRESQLIKPPGALGRLEDISNWLSAWTGKSPPQVTRPIIAVFAGDHGVAARGVSAYPQEVTRQMIDAMAAGGAAISVLAQQAGAGLKVYDLAVGKPTPDIVEADALTEQECVATMAYGMEVLAEGTDLLVLGEVGIGNTTVAAALAMALFGGEASEWTGPGTGVEGPALVAKREVVEAAVGRLGEDRADPLKVLARVGGREFAAIAGAILAARLQRVPVVLDGFMVAAAAAILHQMNPEALDHCIVGHVSAEPGHRALLARLGKQPILDLGMRLGEGTGAALAVQIIKSAVACHAGMATFAEAGVAGPAN